MHEVLAEVDELPPVFGSHAPGLSMDINDPSSVVWIVDADGSEIMRFVGTLEAEGARSTRLHLDLVGVTSGDHGDVEQRFKNHPELRRLYLVAMAEEIDAKFEERPFDITRTYGALASATAANIGGIAAQLDANANRTTDE